MFEGDPDEVGVWELEAAGELSADRETVCLLNGIGRGAVSEVPLVWNGLCKCMSTDCELVRRKTFLRTRETESLVVPPGDVGERSVVTRVGGDGLVGAF